MPVPLTIHVISHTHWDREWYLTLSGFRPKLVKAIDLLLKILHEEPDYVFHLDAQMVLLEDYLDVRPENSELIKQYISRGRLIIGPWYVMPDQFLPSPESLYRNLKLGLVAGSEYGLVMKVGYLPDPFGQTAQMWQLLHLFDIKYAVFRRGMPLLPDQIRSEYRLVSPDGSSVLGHYLHHSYTNARAFGFLHPLSSTLNRLFMPFINTGNTTGGRVDGWRDRAYYFLSALWVFWLTHTLVTIEDAVARPGIVQKETASLKKFAGSPNLLFMHGGDHRPPTRDTGKAIAQANLRQNEFRLVHSTLEKYFEALGDPDQYPVLTGEQRHGYYDPVLPAVLSTRMYLKMENHRVENLAEKWAYPWAGLAKLISGKEQPSEELQKVTRLLIQNHAHDSICGTGVDKLHLEMMDRFRQAGSLFEGAAFDSLESISKQVDTSSVKPGETGLLLFNPSPFERTEIVPFKTICELGSRCVVDASQSEVPAQVDRNGVLFQARVPSFGHRLFRVISGKPTSPPKTVTKSENMLENEHLFVEVAGNGSIYVTSKVDGRRAGPLNWLEDVGDAGDTYNYCPPENDTVINSLDSKAEIIPLTAGPLEAGIHVKYSLKVPLALNARARKRSAKATLIPVETTITLQAGSPTVRIHTVIENTASDHRLRVMFSSNIRTDECSADASWQVLNRPIRFEDLSAAELKRAVDMGIGASPGSESEVSTRPHRRFVDLFDGKFGLAVISSGLPEYEVMDDSARTMALTLLRCVGWLSRTTPFYPPRHGRPTHTRPRGSVLRPL